MTAPGAAAAVILGRINAALDQLAGSGSTLDGAT